MELDHIALIVSKEENLAFYKKLGFKEKNRIERGYDTVVFMENNSIALEIFIDSNHPARVILNLLSEVCGLKVSVEE